MATATAEQTEETTIENNIVVEEGNGPSEKRISVEIPEARIKQKLKEQFTEVRQAAAVPGFRVGKTPMSLIEKRFGSDIRSQVRQELISESFRQVLEKNEFEAVGEPEFIDGGIDKTLPEQGDFKFSFLIEIIPQFTLPEFSKITVRKPKITVGDEHVKQALTNLQNQQGQLVPVEDRGIEANDYLNVSVVVKKGDSVIAEQLDVDVRAQDGMFASFSVTGLIEKIGGAKVGETKTFDLAIPADHFNADVAGETVQFAVTVNDVKKLEPAEIDQDFLEQFGFENDAALMEELRNQMELRVTQDVRTATHNQLRKLLLDQVPMGVPSKLAKRQEGIVVRRRYNQAINSGATPEQVGENIQRLTAGASDQASDELRLHFMFSKLATEAEIEVTESDINSAVSSMAQPEGQRPEKLKQELAANGQLENIAIAIRDGKVLDSILEKVTVLEVEPKEGEVLAASIEA